MFFMLIQVQLTFLLSGSLGPGKKVPLPRPLPPVLCGVGGLLALFIPHPWVWLWF
jgi:hypothetical protein